MSNIVVNPGSFSIDNYHDQYFRDLSDLSEVIALIWSKKLTSHFTSTLAAGLLFFTQHSARSMSDLKRSLVVQADNSELKIEVLTNNNPIK